MQEAPNFMDLLQKLTTRRLLLIGDVMLDRFTYGDVTRLSPEAPVPVLSVTRRTVTAGGVGNVAANLAGLGVETALVTVAGRDSARAELDAVLAAMPGVTPHIVTDATRPTTQKDRFVAGAHHLLRVDDETAGPLAPETESALIAACTRAASGCHGIIVSDYGKGVVTPALLSALMVLNLPVYVDPKGRDYTRYRGAAVVTPNRRELAEATENKPTATDEDVAAAAQSLLDTCGIAAILATRSADGMTLVQNGQGATHLRTRAREVFDVSGAGDTVIATLAAAASAGADLQTAATLANIAAGLVVEKIGTAAITADDLRMALAESATATTIAPVLTWAQAREQAERWQARGLKVGFTNGCFDILHQGHVTMLARARAECDRLILGINCDASVRRLKGPTRPVNDHDARARVVAALGSIDAVVLFGENVAENDTPLDLITALRPDLLFKGADYTVDTVVGAGVVQAYGGRVALIPLEEGFSTTATIKKMSAA